MFVSVLIDTYNHEKFIEQAITSVLEQDYPSSDYEILVVDDGSTDRTPELVKKFGGRVTYLAKENGGQASAFNFGIPRCRGEIVAMLDGDDWWTQDKLRTIIPVFENNPEVGAVGHGCLMVDAQGLQSTIVTDKPYRISVKSISGARLFSQLRCFFGTSKVAYRRSLLEHVLPVPEGAVIEADEFLFTAIPVLADVIVLDKPLFYYRLHQDNGFMLATANERGKRRKFDSLSCLLNNLPDKMKCLGAAPEISAIILAPLANDVEMMRLQLEGGSRLDVLRAERAVYRLDYKSRPLGYRIFKLFSFAMTLLLPPKSFYRLKGWYVESGLRNLRRRLGEPTSAAPILGKMPGE